MMEAILDTNFIISCIKKKIDFVAQLQEMGFKTFLPREVEQELKDLRLKVPHDERAAIDIALDIFATKKVKKMSLGKRSVDEGLIALGKKGAYIATLDSAIKRSVPNRIVLREAQRRVEAERT